MIYYINELLEKLEDLKENYGAFGVKTSFEDEGSLFEEMATLGSLAHQCGMKFSVKIGGCEAKTDIINSIVLNADSVVAPMIESDFALEKWATAIDSVIGDDLKNNYDFYINIESKTAYKNIDNILNSCYIDYLAGIVIGRSDFVKSYGLVKDNVDDENIFERVHDILKKAKSKNLSTFMGGSMSTKSKHFVVDLYKENLLDKIETRNIIINLTDENIDTIDIAVEHALLFELRWLESKEKYYSGLGKNYQNRIDVVKKRT